MSLRAESSSVFQSALAPNWALNPTKWEQPQRSLALVIVIVTMTTLAAIALLPNTEEKAQVLVSQGRVEDAVGLFERKREVTPLNPFETYSLAGLYARQNRGDDLLALLENEIVRRPGSDWAHFMLVSLYRDRGEIANEARILFQTFTHAPKAPDYRRLIAIYRVLGDRAGERSTLEWAKARGLASPADFDRLIYLNSPQAEAATPTEWNAAKGQTSSESLP